MNRLLAFLITPLFLLLAALPADAQILSQSKELLNLTGQSGVGTVTGAWVEIKIDESKSLQGGRRFACRAIAQNNSGTTPTGDFKIQHCSSKLASSCDDLCVFTQCTTGACWTTGKETRHLGNDSVSIFRFLRAVSTLGGTSPNYNVKIEFWYQ